MRTQVMHYAVLAEGMTLCSLPLGGKRVFTNESRWVTCSDCLDGIRAAHALIPPHLQQQQQPDKASSVWSRDAGEELTPLPEAVYAPVVMRDELVDCVRVALRNADLDRARAVQDSERVATAGATTALRYLLSALTTPERDGAATPPAATTGAATPAADESATAVPPAAEAAPSRPNRDQPPANAYPVLETCNKHHRAPDGSMHNTGACSLAFCGRYQ